MDPGDRGAAWKAWPACVALGFAIGAAFLSLGTLIIPLLATALLLIAWKGPRLIGLAGFATGVGLAWTVLFARLALTCGGPLDTGTAGDCDAGDLGPWVVVAAVIFIVGLSSSAMLFSRRAAK